ncbi:unnamed protein product, partial [Prorocentrum cordatum]
DPHGVMLSCCIGESSKYDGVYTSKWNRDAEVFVVHGSVINWDSKLQTLVVPEGDGGLETSYPGEARPRKAKRVNGSLVWLRFPFEDVWVEQQPPAPVAADSAASCAWPSSPAARAAPRAR